MNKTNEVWKEKVQQCLETPDYVSKPRGMEVHEVLNGSYSVPMPAYLDYEERDVNVNFMFAEAAWIVSGSNKLSEVSRHMKKYADFSDDGLFLRGAYGPKVVDQIGYVADSIIKDNDTRQAVMTIWRERPAPSKDIPCTVAMQFLLRDNKLNMITTMRSNDIILGFTYDVFTFSMVAAALQRILKAGGLDVELGTLFVNAGSLHLYESHYKKAEEYLKAETTDNRTKELVDYVLENSPTYESLIKNLNTVADNYDKDFNPDDPENWV